MLRISSGFRWIQIKWMEEQVGDDFADGPGRGMVMET